MSAATLVAVAAATCHGAGCSRDRFAVELTVTLEGLAIPASVEIRALDLAGGGPLGAETVLTRPGAAFLADTGAEGTNRVLVIPARAATAVALTARALGGAGEELAVATTETPRARSIVEVTLVLQGADADGGADGGDGDGGDAGDVDAGGTDGSGGVDAGGTDAAGGVDAGGTDATAATDAAAATDAGPPPPWCGDGFCGPTETNCPMPNAGETSCPADCAPACGDGCCTGAETGCSCDADCGPCCGDGACIAGEDACSCDIDCMSVCGDGCCTGSEDTPTCAMDCPGCGDGFCSGWTETVCDCQPDCAYDCMVVTTLGFGCSCDDGCCGGEICHPTSSTCCLPAGSGCPPDPANCCSGSCLTGSCT